MTREETWKAIYNHYLDLLYNDGDTTGSMYHEFIDFLLSVKPIEFKIGSVKNNELIFSLVEQAEKQPYVLTWIGFHNLPIIRHFSFLEDAIKQNLQLTECGSKTSLMIDVKQLNTVQCCVTGAVIER